MAEQRDGYRFAARLAEVQARGCQVVALDGHTVALFAHDGAVHAIDPDGTHLANGTGCESCPLCRLANRLRTDDPERTVAGPRAVLLGPDTRITEWFTRVSDTELVYRYTVDDASLYTTDRRQ